MALFLLVICLYVLTLMLEYSVERFREIGNKEEPGQ